MITELKLLKNKTFQKGFIDFMVKLFVHRKFSAQQFWNEFVVANLVDERRFKLWLQRYFRSQGRAVLASMPKSFTKERDPFWDLYLPEWNERLKTETSKHYKKVVKREGKRVAENLNEFAGGDFEMRFDVENPNIQQVIERNSGKLAYTVNGTTVEDVRRTVQVGISGGKTIPEIRESIRFYFKGAENYRAERVARTETIRASNYAAVETYKQSGIVEKKTWYTALDERTCPYCDLMHGRTISIEQPFYNEGELAPGVNTEIPLPLNYETVEAPPLHPQCRCTVLPVLIPLSRI